MAKGTPESSGLLQDVLAARQTVEANRRDAAEAIVNTFQLDIDPGAIVGGFENRIALLEVDLRLNRPSDSVSTILYRMAFEPNFPQNARELEASLGAFLPLIEKSRPEVAAGRAVLAEASSAVEAGFNKGTTMIMPLRQTSEAGVMETPDSNLSIWGLRHPTLSWQKISYKYKSGISSVPQLLNDARNNRDVESFLIDFEHVTQPIGPWVNRFTHNKSVEVRGILSDPQGLGPQVQQEVFQRADIGRRLTPNREDQVTKSTRYVYDRPPIADILQGIPLLMAADKHPDNFLRRKGLDMFLQVHYADSRGSQRVPVSQWVAIEPPADAKVELAALGVQPLMVERTLYLHELPIADSQGEISSVDNILKAMGLDSKRARVTRVMPNPTDLLRSIPLDL